MGELKALPYLYLPPVTVSNEILFCTWFGCSGVFVLQPVVTKKKPKSTDKPTSHQTNRDDSSPDPNKIKYGSSRPNQGTERLQSSEVPLLVPVPAGLRSGQRAAPARPSPR